MGDMEPDPDAGVRIELDRTLDVLERLCERLGLDGPWRPAPTQGLRVLLFATTDVVLEVGVDIEDALDYGDGWAARGGLLALDAARALHEAHRCAIRRGWPEVRAHIDRARERLVELELLVPPDKPVRDG